MLIVWLFSSYRMLIRSRYVRSQEFRLNSTTASTKVPFTPLVPTGSFLATVQSVISDAPGTASVIVTSSENVTARSSLRLVRVTDELTLRKSANRFFRLRDSQSGLWLSRSIDTNADSTGDTEKVFQFRYHSGKYDAWSIQAHTRMYLTSELSDRVTVDRMWARGFEMWFLVFGGISPASSSTLARFLSKAEKNNKYTNTSGEYVYIISRRNRRALAIQGSSLWSRGSLEDEHGAMRIGRFELYVEAHGPCSLDERNASAMEARLGSAPGGAHNFSLPIEDKRNTLVGRRSEARRNSRANACWGPAQCPKCKRNFSASNAIPAIPLIGSPKPPTQFFPKNDTDPFDSVTIARRTILNWALLPGMAPLLFAENDLVVNLARNVTLSVLNSSAMISFERNFEIQRAYAQPTYRGLFSAAFRRFPTVASIMYSNMDILFTSHLRETIEAAIRFADEHRRKHLRLLDRASLPHSEYRVRGWMIVGRRVNYKVPANWTLVDTSGFDTIEDFATKGDLFESDAEDYFVVSRGLFDWDEIPDFVVGGVAFDNWLVHRGNTMAIAGEAIIIDATRTIVALHQNHGRNSKGSHKHPKSAYNSNLALSHGGFTLGHTTDALFATEFNNNGEVSVYDKHRLLYK